MSEWVLILTMIAGSYSSTELTQIGPFESRELCLKARSAWLQSLDVTHKSATCVQTKYARR